MAKQVRQWGPISTHANPTSTHCVIYYKRV